jgi:hypothetical protein
VDEIAPVTASAPEFTAASVEVPVAPSVVNAPAAGVLAPTVPLIFIEAVPVKFVTIPLLGVPRAGVTRVGLVFKTLLPVPVFAMLTAFLLASSASAVDAVNPEIVIPGTMVLVPAASRYTARSAGCVQMTSFTPAANTTKLPVLLESNTVSRDSVLPDVE